MAGRPSRNLSLPDRLCRRLITRATAVALEHGFLRDKLAAIMRASTRENSIAINGVIEAKVFQLYVRGNNYDRFFLFHR